MPAWIMMMFQSSKPGLSARHFKYIPKSTFWLWNSLTDWLGLLSLVDFALYAGEFWALSKLIKSASSLVGKLLWFSNGCEISSWGGVTVKFGENNAPFSTFLNSAKTNQKQKVNWFSKIIKLLLTKWGRLIPNQLNNFFPCIIGQSKRRVWSWSIWSFYC